MEYHSGEILSDLIKSKQISSTLIFKRVSFDIIMVLSYTHLQGIARRDIKPANIYFDNIGRTKLADFGLSKHFGGNDMIKQCCGSLPYESPKIILKNECCPFAVDIYAPGITFYCFASESLP